jgi:hypothetical protein
VNMNRVRIVALSICVLAGCATQGERVDVVIPGPSADAPSPSGATVAKTGKGLRVVVSPFDDARSDRMHLGRRSHLWGSTSYFDLTKGTAGEAVAKSIVQQLNRSGWDASLAGQGGSTRPDATISGTIQDLSVNAISKFGHTEIAAKNTMMVRVANHTDESSIQERVLGSGSDEVFWFDPEDAQQLVNEVLEKNIEKFLADTKVDGQALRLR